MTRLFLGGALGGLAMWLVGFIFWGTPLSLLALSQTDAATTAAVQAALAQHLGPLGSGAYPIPWAGTPQGTQLYGQGPTALVMFNTGGFAMPDSGALIGGLAAGAIIGGAIAAGQANAAAQQHAAYCAQRYRSYDPASNTFLARDGNRYPCQ